MSKDLVANIDRILHEPANSYGGVCLAKAIELPFAPDQPMTLQFNPAEVSREEMVAVLERLHAITLDDRRAFEPLLWAFYCQEIADGAGNYDSPQEQLDWEADFDKYRTFPNPVHATQPNEVWSLVRFTQLRVGRHNGVIYVIVGGTTAWDGDHGITFNFDEHSALIKVDHW